MGWIPVRLQGSVNVPSDHVLWFDEMAASNPEGAAALANLLTKVARYAVVLGAAGSLAQASMYNGECRLYPSEGSGSSGEVHERNVGSSYAMRAPRERFDARKVEAWDLLSTHAWNLRSRWRSSVADACGMVGFPRRNRMQWTEVNAWSCSTRSKECSIKRVEKELTF